jgi:hypothetical protein
VDLPRIRIPVFVSCPSDLSAQQEQSAKIIHGQLKQLKLEWRALGRNEYPDDLALREVLRMIKHCSGGVILGFEQFRAPSGVFKRGTPKQDRIRNRVLMPTPWNQLEAGVLFNQELPILIFREPGIRGGIFDVGTTEVFIHDMPVPGMSRSKKDALEMVFQKWSAKVYKHYYGD